MATQMANKATNRCQQFKVTEIKIKNGNNTQTKVIQIQQGQAGSRVCGENSSKVLVFQKDNRRIDRVLIAPVSVSTDDVQNTAVLSGIMI